VNPEPENARRFAARAASYATARPSYPAALRDALFADMGAPESLVVADIGAGTGISSRFLAATGARVYAVEPSAAMREHAEEHERVAAIDGTAHDTTLYEGTVDVVTAFQAFHWFADAAAFAEFRRILRPGGRIAAALTERDETQPFARAYGAVIRAHAIGDVEERRLASLATFARLAGGPVARSTYANPQTLDRERLLRRLASTSYIAHEGAEGAAVRDAALAAYERFAAPDGTVVLAQTTTLLLTQR
jgi:SAM-dependent methyltransferase